MKTSRSVDSRLDAFASETLEACDAVLVRAWLVGPGDSCATCALRPECPDQRACLHLAVSVGLSQSLDGPYRRFPIGARRVGRVVVDRKPYLERGDLAARGIADPAWLAMHGVRSFAAVPLGEGRGVLAVFSRRFLTDPDLRLLAFAARAAAHGLGDPLPSPREARPMRAESAPPRARPPRPEIVAGAETRTLAEIQRDAIERALVETGGRISGPRGAATMLGLKPSTLVSRMQKLGVRRPV
jgi:regulatory Fis family protein/GAF domain-containing protein